MYHVGRSCNEEVHLWMKISHPWQYFKVVGRQVKRSPGLLSLMQLLEVRHTQLICTWKPM